MNFLSFIPSLIHREKVFPVVESESPLSLNNSINDIELLPATMNIIKEEKKDNAMTIHEEVYIPLEFAKETIRKILADWTAMKQEYIKTLKDVH